MESKQRSNSCEVVTRLALLASYTAHCKVPVSGQENQQPVLCWTHVTGNISKYIYMYIYKTSKKKKGKEIFTFSAAFSSCSCTFLFHLALLP